MFTKNIAIINVCVSHFSFIKLRAFSIQGIIMPIFKNVHGHSLLVGAAV